MLVVDDPFLVENTDKVIHFLNNNNPGFCSGFSIDIGDVYYSLPHKGIMKAVKKYITDDNDEVGFMGKCECLLTPFLNCYPLS